MSLTVVTKDSLKLLEKMLLQFLKGFVKYEIRSIGIFSSGSDPNFRISIKEVNPPYSA